MIASYEKRPAAEREILYNAVADARPRRVLDLGCGPGQELLPFAERSGAVCIGVDIGEDLGKIAPAFFAEKGLGGRGSFVRAGGERLPFADGSFDVVLCRVALPYMNNRLAIAEVGRVLTRGGTFLLKTHAPPFYVGMLRERAGSFSPKQLAYPAICLAAGLWHSLSGSQPTTGIFKGKEIYQTRGFLEKELRKHGLMIVGELSDSNPQTPSYRIEKQG